MSGAIADTKLLSGQPKPESGVNAASQQENALAVLFAAHAVSRPDAQQGLLAFVEHLIAKVTWFGPHLLAALDTSSLPPASVSVRASARLSGQLDRHWQYATLQEACQSRISGMWVAAAVVSLALIARHKDQRTAISTAALEDLSSKVRSASRTPQRMLERLFRSALTPATPAELAALISNELQQTDNQDFSRQWKQEWRPWLERLTAVPSDSLTQTSEPPEGSAPDVRGTEDPRRPSEPTQSVGSASTGGTKGATSLRPREDYRNPFPVESIRLPTQPIEDGDHLEGIEPPEEAASSAEIVVPPTSRTGATTLTRAQERALCFQSIRQQNTELLTEHFEVLSWPEIRYLREASHTAFELALTASDLKTAGELVCYDLVSCTGCDWSIVTGIEISQTAPERDDRLVIALREGLLWRPVIRPAGASSVTPAAEIAAAPISLHFPLPLPPTVVSRLQRVFSSAKMRTLGELVGDVSASKRHVKDSLVGRTTIPRLTVSISRARRLVATRIMETSNDLAATVIICGDDLGKSNAPTYYYGPKICDLAALYKTAIWPLFGDQPIKAAEANPTDGHRVGSRSLVKDRVLEQAFTKHAKEISRFVRESARVKVKNPIAFHNARTAYVLQHFCTTTTHRPIGRLFTLRRSAIDTESGLALIEDKRVDVAHLFRPVALSDLLCRQLDLHLTHLTFLAEVLPTKFAAKEAAQNALRDTGPIFFFIEPDGTTSADLKSWSLHLPEALKAIPSNWYRHVFATRMREIGAQAPDVLVQCGHLEAVGYPFGRTGTLSPVLLCRSLQPTLARFEQALGFELCASAISERGQDTLPPLFSWASHIQRHAQTVRSIDWKYLRKLASATRLNKELGKTIGRSILINVAPQIVSLKDRLERKEDVRLTVEERPAYRLTNQQAAAILDQLETTAVDAAIRLAARMYIAGILRHIKSAYKLEIVGLGNVFHYRVGEPTPFFEDSLLALRQVKNLRACFLGQAAKIRADHPLVWQTLSLALLAGIDTRVELELALSGAISEHRTGLINLDGPCLMFDPANGQGRATGFAGLAALALTGADRQATLSLDETSKIIHALFKPQFSACEPGDALDLLLGCVSVANRYELSGLARYAVSQEGSVPALYEVQKAFLLGGLPGPIETSASGTSDADSAEPDTQLPELQDKTAIHPKADRLRALRDAKTFIGKVQYACRIATHGGGDRPAQRREMIENLELLCNSIPINAPTLVEHAIAHFALDVARNGTATERDLAPSTIRTYVSAVTSLLNEQLAGQDISGMRAEDLDHEYLKIVEEHTDVNSQRRTAAQLLRLHNMLVQRGSAEPLEDSGLTEFLGKSARAVDADLVLDSEFRLAISWLETQKTTLAAGTPQAQALQRRTLKLAIIMMKILRHSGCRFSEVAFLRHEDIFIFRDSIVLLVRRHLFRRLKSAAARRRVDIIAADEDIHDINSFVRGERLRHGSNLRPKTLLFCDLDKVRQGPNVTSISKQISRAFSEGAGRKNWPHRLRHLKTQERVMATLPFELDARVTSSSDWSSRGRMLSAATVALGHRTLATTISSYFHFGWAVRAIERRELTIQVDRRIVAGIAGISPATAAKQKQRSVRRRDQALLSSRQSRWEDDILVRRSRKLSAIPDENARSSLPTNRQPFTITQVIRWLRRVNTTDDLTLIMSAEGFSRPDTDRLREVLDTVASDYNFAFLTDNLAGRKQIRTPRSIDSLDHDVIAAEIDSLPKANRTLLAHLLVRCDRQRSAERHNQFSGSLSDLLDLRSIVEQLKIGLPQLQIVKEPVAGEKNAAMVLDPGAPQTPFDLLRWVLYAVVVCELESGQFNAAKSGPKNRQSIPSRAD